MNKIVLNESFSKLENAFNFHKQRSMYQILEKIVEKVGKITILQKI